MRSKPVFPAPVRSRFRVKGEAPQPRAEGAHDLLASLRATDPDRNHLSSSLIVFLRFARLSRDRARSPAKDPCFR
jgi:hypothetical protein